MTAFVKPIPPALIDGEESDADALHTHARLRQYEYELLAEAFIVGSGVYLGFHVDPRGNARGNGAVDLSTTRTADTQVASGSKSINMGENCTASNANAIAIGKDCTASAANATAIGHGCTASQADAIAIGRDCVASANAALALGYEANARFWGCKAFSSSGTNLQMLNFTMGGTVTHSTSTPTLLELLPGIPGYRPTIPANAVWTVRALISGADATCTKTWGYELKGVLKNGLSGTSIESQLSATAIWEEDENFTVTLGADTVNNALQIFVADSGESGDVVRWNAAVEVSEVVYAA